MADVVFSFDDGYGQIKAKCGEKELILPNITEEAFETVSEIFGKDDRIVYRGEEGTFVLGESLLDTNFSDEWFGGLDKHSQLEFNVIAKTVFGSLLEAESSEIDLLLMALPPSVHATERIQLLEEKLKKKHVFAIQTATGEVDKEVKVLDLEVKKQPFGSFAEILFNVDGTINEDSTVQTGLTMIVDLGSRTTIFYTLNKMKEVNELSETSVHGMYAVYKKIADSLTSRTGQTINSARLPLLVKEKQFAGKDITPIINALFKKRATEIYKKVNTLLTSANATGMLTNLIFTGGGCTLLEEYLEPLFKDVHYDVHYLDQMANVRGMHKYGKFLMAKKSKKTLKPKAKIKAKIGSGIYDEDEE